MTTRGRTQAPMDRRRKYRPATGPMAREQDFSFQ